MIAERSRIVVVFPAPSGPTRPKSSPRRTSRSMGVDGYILPERLCQACHLYGRIIHYRAFLPQDFVFRPYSCPLLVHHDAHVGGHAGLQFSVLVLYPDLYAEHEFYPFLLRLDGLGREFRFRRDVAHLAVERLALVAVHGNLRLLPQFHENELIFLHIDLDPRLCQVSQGDNGCPLGHRLSRLHVFS